MMSPLSSIEPTEPAIIVSTQTARKRSLVAVIASMVIVNLVYGLTLPLLSLVLDAQGALAGVCWRHCSDE